MGNTEQCVTHTGDNGAFSLHTSARELVCWGVHTLKRSQPWQSTILKKITAIKLCRLLHVGHIVMQISQFTVEKLEPLKRESVLIWFYCFYSHSCPTVGFFFFISIRLGAIMKKDCVWCSSHHGPDLLNISCTNGAKKGCCQISHYLPPSQRSCAIIHGDPTGSSWGRGLWERDNHYSMYLLTASAPSPRTSDTDGKKKNLRLPGSVGM